MAGAANNAANATDAVILVMNERMESFRLSSITGRAYNMGAAAQCQRAPVKTFTASCGVTSRLSAAIVREFVARCRSVSLRQSVTDCHNFALRPHLARRIYHRMKAACIIDRATNVHFGGCARKFLNRKHSRLGRLEDLCGDAVDCRIE